MNVTLGLWLIPLWLARVLNWRYDYPWSIISVCKDFIYISVLKRQSKGNPVLSNLYLVLNIGCLLIPKCISLRDHIGIVH